MQKYKYETHAHTSEVSRCSKITAVELVQFYKERGYSGICITDHFFNGNTTVPKELPWADRVDLFCEGYEKAYEEGKKIGIDVFFAWEYPLEGTDFLTYGLNKEWLLNHPEVTDIDINEYCDLVHKCGGFIVHAHPFREASYIAMIRLLPRKVDAVEVDNACRTDFENKLADEYANNYKLLKTAGSDNHKGKLDRLSGLQFDATIKDLEDMIIHIKAGEAELFSD